MDGNNRFGIAFLFQFSSVFSNNDVVFFSNMVRAMTLKVMNLQGKIQMR